MVATDACDPSPDFVLDSVTSSEPDNGTGDGDTVDDIQGADTGTDDREFQLRAERAGNGSGRVYTAIGTVTDESGNTTHGLAQIVVPHDQGDAKADKAAKAAAKAAKAAAKAAKKAAKDAAKAADKAAKAASEGRAKAAGASGASRGERVAASGATAVRPGGVPSAQPRAARQGAQSTLAPQPLHRQHALDARDLLHHAVQGADVGDPDVEGLLGELVGRGGDARAADVDAACRDGLGDGGEQPGRSSERTRILMLRGASASGCQVTSMRRDGSSSKAFGQSATCTVTPRPRVTKPTTSSPGSGAQQRAKRTITSDCPPTRTPAAALRGRAQDPARPRRRGLRRLAAQRAHQLRRRQAAVADPRPAARRPSRGRSGRRPRSSPPLLEQPRQRHARLAQLALQDVAAELARARVSAARIAWRMRLRALPVTTKSSQSLRGTCAAFVMTSTVSPFASRWRSGTMRPFTFAPAQCAPTSLWIA